MVWQLHCPSIVMMTNLEEGRKKCERYWPKFGTADYGPYTVTLAEEKTQADYTIRKLTLTVSTIMTELQETAIESSSSVLVIQDLDM